MHCTKDFSRYIQDNYSTDEYLKTFHELSSDRKSPPKYLVKSKQKGYDFDKIVREISEGDQVRWRSVDSVKIGEKRTEFIEFKSGFRTRLTRDEIISGYTYQCPDDLERTNCIEVNRVIDKYCYIFNKFRNAQIEQLIVEVQLKMLETLKFLECKLCPISPECDRELKLKFVLVADCKYTSGDASSAYLDMQLQCAKPTETRESGLVDRLKKYLREELHGKIGLYFDEVEVLEADEFDEKYA